MQDGVNTLLFGQIHSIPDPLVIVGGNCSITGYDMATASEQFWTVTGDNVNALTMADIDFDGEDELITGSDDLSIRIFRHEELMFDIKEPAKVNLLDKID